MPDFKSTLQALLFVYGEPIKISRLADILKISEKQVETTALELKDDLAKSGGLSLINHDNRLQLITKPEFGEIIGEIIKSETKEDLSPASLETLSIVAYLGPVPRTTIDYIRGVNSTFILRSLLIRGLVERNQDPKKLNSFLYRISFEALKYLGVTSVEDLPEFNKYKELSKNFNNESTTS